MQFPFEVIIVAEPDSMPELEAKFRGLENLVVIQNTKRLYRGPSVLQGLKKGRGKYLMPLVVDHAMPLAEILVFLSAALEIEKNDPAPKDFLVIGNRYGVKKKRPGPRPPLRNFFEEVEQSKCAGLPVKDPLCPIFLMPKDTVRLLENAKLKRWFYTPAVLAKILSEDISVTEVDIHYFDTVETRFSFWQALL